MERGERGGGTRETEGVNKGRERDREGEGKVEHRGISMSNAPASSPFP